jgi:hypothetical protein
MGREWLSIRHGGKVRCGLAASNASLEDAVKEMRDAADAIAKAAAVLGFADRAIGLLAGLFL